MFKEKSIAAELSMRYMVDRCKGESAPRQITISSCSLLQNEAKSTAIQMAGMRMVCFCIRERVKEAIWRLYVATPRYVTIWKRGKSYTFSPKLVPDMSVISAR